MATLFFIHNSFCLQKMKNKQFWFTLRYCLVYQKYYWNGFDFFYLINLRQWFPTCSQFHQHFMRSFYASRSQKRQKDSKLKQLFALSGSVGIKASNEHVGEIETWGTHTSRREISKGTPDFHYSWIRGC